MVAGNPRLTRFTPEPTGGPSPPTRRSRRAFTNPPRESAGPTTDGSSINATRRRHPPAARRHPAVRRSGHLSAGIARVPRGAVCGRVLIRAVDGIRPATDGWRRPNSLWRTVPPSADAPVGRRESSGPAGGGTKQREARITARSSEGRPSAVCRQARSSTLHRSPPGPHSGGEVVRPLRGAIPARRGARARPPVRPVATGTERSACGRPCRPADPVEPPGPGPVVGPQRPNPAALPVESLRPP